MREHPIIFSAPMVRAILEGRKTETRRVFKVCGVDGRAYAITSPKEEILRMDDGTFHYLSTAALSGPYECPYGQPGDRLWVRETWGIAGDMPHDPGYVEYRADCHGNFNGVGDAVDRWRPSIHMRREDSRITLEITDVRVQRVQDISYEDAIAEGITDPATMQEFPHGIGTGETVAEYCRRTGFPQRQFRDLWDSINGKRGFGWNENPYVWALTFKRVEE